MKSIKNASLILLCLLLYASATNANPSFSRPVKTPRINGRLEKHISSIPSGEQIKVWVFFTDKGFFDNQVYSQKIRELENKVSDKMIERRMKRLKKNDLFDYYDIPVYKNYIDAIRNKGATIVHSSKWLNAVSVMADSRIIDNLAELAFVSEIRKVAMSTQKPELPVVSKSSAELPDSVINWYGFSFKQLDMLNIPILHQFGYFGEGIRIAIFDAGFETGVAAFDSVDVVDQYDFVDDDPIAKTDDPSQIATENFHGTQVFSVIGGYIPNRLIGPAYKAEYLLARTEIADPAIEIHQEEDNWVAAAEWADSLGADIITSSLGYYDWYDYHDLDGNTALITIAADLAVSRGIVVFNSTGNTGNEAFHYISPPADGDSVIAVGAVDTAGVIASFTGYGPTYDNRIKPDILALGTHNYTISYNGTFAFTEGTSYTAPLAAGVGALLLEIYPDWSPMDVRQALIESGNRYENPDNRYGYGLIDAFKASKLLYIDPVDPIIVSVGDSVTKTFTVTGLPDSSVQFSAYNLPLSAVFEDNGDRTAILYYKAVEGDLGMNQFQVTADFGSGSYTLNVILTVVSQSHITAGPNPFTDSVSIFIGPNDGRLIEISIHTVNGEKVWDKYSDNYNMATASVVWNGKNNFGSEVASGVYFVVVRTERSLRRLKIFKR